MSLGKALSRARWTLLLYCEWGNVMYGLIWTRVLMVCAFVKWSYATRLGSGDVLAVMDVIQRDPAKLE